MSLKNRKPSKHKKPRYKKHSPKKTKSGISRYLFLLPLLLIAFSFAIYIFFIALEQKESKKDTPIATQKPLQKIEKKETKEQESIKKLKEIIASNRMYENRTTVLDKSVNLSEIDDYKESAKKESIKPIPQKIQKKPPKDELPKLAIIIDDVAFISQARHIKSIGLEITPSIMPKSNLHPDTPAIASMFPFYMVHMPMEALRFNKEEKITLKISDSFDTLEKKITDITAPFPSAIFINNHTGSKFTSDLQAMDNLFKIFKKKGFIFIDSRTTPDTKAQNAAKKCGMKILSRDVFLDNELNSKYIKNQLRQAVNRAKKNGYAIAIGHPSRVTLETIRDSKDILKEVEVVYLDKLFKFVYNDL